MKKLNKPYHTYLRIGQVKRKFQDLYNYLMRFVSLDRIKLNGNTAKTAIVGVIRKPPSLLLLSLLDVGVSWVISKSSVVLIVKSAPITKFLKFT